MNILVALITAAAVSAFSVYYVYDKAKCMSWCEKEKQPLKEFVEHMHCTCGEDRD
jgi:hypothetical protein